MAALLRRLRSDGTPLLALAAGDTFYRSETAVGGDVDGAQVAAQDALKADALVALLQELDVRAILLGPADLRRATAQLRTISRRGKVSLISSEATTLDGVELSASGVMQLGGHDVVFVPDAGGLDDARRAGAVLVLSLSRQQSTGGTPATTRQLTVWLRKSPEGISSPLHVELGHQGEQLTVLNLQFDRSSLADSSPSAPLEPTELTVQHYALRHEKGKDPEVRRLLNQVFDRISQTNERVEGASELAADSATHYVGSRTCAACHTAAYEWWLRAPHGRAYETLLARRRAFDLDCVSCHVTGYGQPGGASLGSLQELRGVGCESCHGPGSRHVTDPQSREGRISREVGARVCTGCHDEDHSLGFDYQAKVRHLRSAAHAPAQSQWR